SWLEKAGGSARARCLAYAALAVSARFLTLPQESQVPKTRALTAASSGHATLAAGGRALCWEQGEAPTNWPHPRRVLQWSGARLRRRRQRRRQRDETTSSAHRCSTGLESTQWRQLRVPAWRR